MSQSTFFLTWDSHKNILCTGLSALQQNGEFVDMTLAADGHLVKVHQMVMALVSPYLKELIATADKQHPVIFLNKVSYTTLSAILEYIYTGEVTISVENLPDLVQAAKELHIKGLEDMTFQGSEKDKVSVTLEQEQAPLEQADNSEEDTYFFEVNNDNTLEKTYSYIEDSKDEEIPMDTEGSITIEADDSQDVKEVNMDKSEMPLNNVSDIGIQFTVSNQGSLQMILNRYMYYLKYTNKNNTRQWRCVDYLNNRKCPALVVTNNNIVVRRISAHTHPFHDKRILKKVNGGAIYAAITEAEDIGESIRSKAKQLNRHVLGIKSDNGS